MATPLPVVNLDTATFECVFGRGCDGICCQKGKPPVTPDDIARIDLALPKVLPHLREEARKKIEMLFAHLKRILKLDRLRLRGPSGARDEFLLAATAQNLRRMAKWLSSMGRRRTSRPT